MSRTISSKLDSSRRQPLAVCISAFFGLVAPAAMAATNWPVGSCLDDGGSTTLRGVIAAVTTVSGDSVDLSGLDCVGSTITLANGGSHIEIDQPSLTIKGPPGSNITIDGSQLAEGGNYNYSNILWHKGAGGTLTVSNVTLTGGHQKHYHADALGGCLYSAGNVSLTDVSVTQCTATALSYGAEGAGVYAKGNLTLDHTYLKNNTASGPGSIRGGGAFALGNITLTGGSTIVSNKVQSTFGATKGGGLYSLADISLTESLVSSNVSTSAGGAVVGGANGGGVFTTGSVTVSNSIVEYNSALSTVGGASAGGGGIYAGYLKLQSSSVYNNVVKTVGPLDGAYGGGAKVLGSSKISYSTVSGNQAQGHGFGAGLILLGADHSILSSAVTGNHSEYRYAGVNVTHTGTPAISFVLRNSTISGNSADDKVGGMYVTAATARFYNSTIAFNTAVGGSSGPGVRLFAPNPSMAVTLQSTLMSNNTSTTGEDDLDSNSFSPIVFNGGGVNLATPANNLIRVTSIPAALLPTDTKFGSCPDLGPLRFNGGLTPTHAPMSKSVAIDTGNTNAVGLGAYDQRGSAVVNGELNYLRVSGPAGDPSPKADIGAYEVQQDQITFNADFEGCP
jgi:hypothetical protein